MYTADTIPYTIRVVKRIGTHKRLSEGAHVFDLYKERVRSSNLKFVCGEMTAEERSEQYEHFLAYFKSALAQKMLLRQQPKAVSTDVSKSPSVPHC